MKQKFLPIAWIAMLVFFLPSNIISQENNLKKELNEKIQFNKISLTDQATVKPIDGKLAEYVSKGTVFELDAKRVAEFSDIGLEEFLFEIPNANGKPIVIELTRNHIFGKDFKVTTDGNKDVAMDLDLGLHYGGKVQGETNSLAALSVFRDQITGFVWINDNKYSLSRLDNTSPQHLFFDDVDLINQEDYICTTSDAVDEFMGYTDEQLFSTPEATGDCINIFVETDRTVYDALGSSVPATTFYATSLMNSAITIYATSSITVKMSQLVVNTVSYYANGSALAGLTAVQGAYNGFNGDLYNCIFAVNFGGRAAGFAGLCNANPDNSMCVSGWGNNGMTNYAIATFSHELGHLFGSRHTHACVWNGNSTAIDGCSGFTEGACALPGAPPPPGGTIMSYCSPTGAGFSNTFHPQPSSVIQNNVTNANCLTAACLPVPSNDLCSGASTLSCGSNVIQNISTATATDNPNVFCGTSSNGFEKGVWYKYTAATNTRVTLSTCNVLSNYDTKLQVFRGSCGSLICVTGNDDDFGCALSIRRSTAIWCTTSGTTYYIYLYGFGGATGIAQLTLSCNNAPPVISCPANITVNAAAGTCAASVTFSASVTDDCPGTTITYTHTSGASYGVGVTTVTAKATDAGGLIATCSFTITVVDNQNPIINCPGNFTTVTNPGVCCSVVFYTVTASDNCPGVTWVQTGGFPTGSCFPKGTTVNTFVATDAAGNTSSCSFTLTVVDNEPPVITCPGNITVNNDPGQCCAVVIYGMTVSDNCPGVNWTQISGIASASCFPVGTTTNVWRAIDAVGLVSTCSFTVTVVDNEPPTINCPANATTVTNPGVCCGTVFYTVTASDNCPGVSWTLTGGLPTGSCFPKGTTTNTFVATDAAGNTSSCSFTITVIDNEPPVITCPPNITVNNDPGLCCAVVIYGMTVSDNCPGVNWTQISGIASGSCFPVGTTTNVWRAIDAVGLVTTCSFTVTVIDNEPPTINCPANFVTINDPGLCCGTVFYTVTANDNCPGVTWVLTGGLPSGSCFPVGVTTNTFLATDVAGNTASCSFTITVNDTEPPVPFCNDTTVCLDSTGKFIINLGHATGVASGDDSICFNYTGGVQSFTVPSGITSVNIEAWGAQGGADGGTAGGQGGYAKGDLSVSSGQVLQIYVGGMGLSGPGSGQNCNMNGGWNGGGPTGDTCCSNAGGGAGSGGGASDVRISAYTINDRAIVAAGGGGAGSGNIGATGGGLIGTNGGTYQSVTATGGTQVAGGQPGGHYLFHLCNQGTAGTFGQGGKADGNDGGGGGGGWYGGGGGPNNGGGAGGSSYIGGVSGGTTTTGGRTGDGKIWIRWIGGGAHATDNCAVDSVWMDADTFMCMDVGINTVTVTALDIHGNTGTCTSLINVRDKIPPYATKHPYPIFWLDTFGQVFADPLKVVDSTWDNCGIDTIELDRIWLNCADFGTIMVTMTVTDLSGNTSTCLGPIGVFDGISPIAGCKDTTLYLDSNGNAWINTWDLESGSWDNCSYGVNNSLVHFTWNHLGVNWVTVLIYDPQNNQDTCHARVTILDTLNPNIFCRDTMFSNDAGLCSATVSWTPPSASAGATVTQTSGPSSGSSLPVGVTTVTYQASLPSGNSSSCSMMITVKDDEPPVITCPGDRSRNVLAGSPGRTVKYPTPTATDNCGIASITHVSGGTSGSFFPVGVTVVTWKATDIYGNMSTCSFTVTVVAVIPTLSMEDNSMEDGASKGSDANNAGSHNRQGDPDPFDNAILKLYPNPTSGYFVLEVERVGYSGKLNIEIYDLLGRRVYTSSERFNSFFTLELDLRDQNSGQFMVHLRLGDMMLTRKLILIK